MNPPSVRRWLVEAAARIEAALGPARVRRIVLPPLAENPGKEGEFCAVQLDDGAVGLAFVLLDGTLAALHSGKRDLPRAGVPAMDLVQGYGTGDLAARALGLAAINALARRLYDRAGFVPEGSVDSFGSLALQAGDRLGMVGHFSPLIREARALGVPVTVLELRADLVREEPGLSVTLDPQRLAACNKIVSTSTLLLNDTFEQVSTLWRDADAVAIVGPSAGCPPDPLFAAGVSSVGSAWVVDAEALLGHLAAGEKWGAAARKITLTRATYPGLDALLRAGGQ
ncbi:MAG TPA: DUF364 domain-containing protein [Burkholderiales bacterium]|nr:DUF364 domain-containing protein [Burkholderiales bacterium]